MEELADRGERWREGLESLPGSRRGSTGSCHSRFPSHPGPLLPTLRPPPSPHSTLPLRLFLLTPHDVQGVVGTLLAETPRPRAARGPAGLGSAHGLRHPGLAAHRIRARERPHHAPRPRASPDPDASPGPSADSPHSLPPRLSALAAPFTRGAPAPGRVRPFDVTVLSAPRAVSPALRPRFAGEREPGEQTSNMPGKGEGPGCLREGSRAAGGWGGAEG